MESKETTKLASLGLSVGERRFEKLTAIKKSPIGNAVVGKMVRAMDSTGGFRNRAGSDTPAAGYLARVSETTANTVTDTTNLYQLLPDTDLAEKILVSSILSPKDMVNSELNYVVGDTKLPPEITGPLLTVVEDFFTKSYKIDSILPKILSDVLFRRGSYPMVIIPESSVDDIINGDSRITMETLKGGESTLFKLGIGILANSKLDGGSSVPTRRDNVSMESITQAFNQNVTMTNPRIKGSSKSFDTRITVCDNPDILKAPFLKKRIQHQKIVDTFKQANFGMESRQEISRDDIENSFYRPRSYQPRAVVSVKTSDQVEKKTVGHPLVMRLPSESIIPVHVPGSPEEHVGYFVLIDPSGNPISKANRADYYNDLSSNLSASKEMSSQLIAQGRRSIEGQVLGNTDSDIDQATKIYADIIEEDLIARLRNGVYSDTVEIARPLEVYRIMLARTFANMSTQLLYVPVELVSYFAFDYNEYGVGKSLLEDNKILASLRVMMLLANTMAAIKNSVPHTGLNITLDPNDPDPSTTVEKLVHNYAATRQASYPLGASNPVDVVSYLQNAGVDVHVTGSPAYPETRMDVEDRQRSVVEPNTTLEESLKKRYLMSLGLSPETVDSSYNVEFATSIVSSNLLLTKRVMVYQDKFTALLSDFIRKYILNSGELFSKMIRVIESSIKDAAIVDSESKSTPEDIVHEFIRILEVTLPRPDSITLERQMEAYDKYVEALDKALDAYFNADFLVGTALGDQGDQVEPIKAAILAHFKRKWLRENNVLPELNDLVTFTDDKHPLIDLMELHGDHIEAISASIQGYAIKVAEAKKARDELTEKVEKEKGIELGGGSTDYSSDDESEGGGDDDLDLGVDGEEEQDVDLDEETEEEAPEEEEEAPEEESEVTEESVDGGGIDPHKSEVGVRQPED